MLFRNNVFFLFNSYGLDYIMSNTLLICDSHHLLYYLQNITSVFITWDDRTFRTTLCVLSILGRFFIIFSGYKEDPVKSEQEMTESKCLI